MGKQTSWDKAWEDSEIHRRRKIRGKRKKALDKALRQFAKGLSGHINAPSVKWFDVTHDYTFSMDTAELKVAAPENIIRWVKA